MTTDAPDVEGGGRAPTWLLGSERAMLGGLAGIAAGFPAQEVIVLVRHIPIGTSPLGAIAVAVLVPAGALAGLLWPHRWRRARRASTTLHR